MSETDPTTDIDAPQSTEEAAGDATGDATDEAAGDATGEAAGDTIPDVTGDETDGTADGITGVVDGGTAPATAPGEHAGDETVPSIQEIPEGQAVLRARDLTVHYGDVQALKPVNVGIPEQEVTAIIGPSGCGKSTFLRCINRMNDMVDAARVEGELLFRGTNVYDDAVDPVALRRKIGMVFQKPNPFPKSIYDNVAYGLKIQGYDGDLDARVEEALRNAALWDEVKDQLDSSGLDLSGGQQQRLCIARAIAPDPEVILMDEPASALDPVATAKVEDLIDDLAAEYTVVIVTHNMQQAARISDKTAVFLTGGQLVEFGDTNRIFENPDNQRVEDYITGKFG